MPDPTLTLYGSLADPEFVAFLRTQGFNVEVSADSVEWEVVIPVLSMNLLKHYATTPETIQSLRQLPTLLPGRRGSGVRPEDRA